MAEEPLEDPMVRRLRVVREWSSKDPRRTPFEPSEYLKRARSGRCFLCVMGEAPEQLPGHQLLYQDERAIAFLDRYPTQTGHALVAPRGHVEHACRDMAVEEYLELQRVVHVVGQALQRVLDSQRIYICSLGALEVHPHLHFHLVPIPEGTPYEAQENVAMMKGVVGVLRETDEEREALAARVRRALSER